MDGKLILVTGGGRSGKSIFAEKLVHSFGKKCAYIATAQITDDEMKKRVEQHKARRKDDFWVNYEAPLHADKIISQIKDVESILFDCLTIYLSNLLYADEGQKASEKEVFYQIELLIQSARKSGKNVVFVTNELGSSLVPFEPDSREFRDLAGLVNQWVAKSADDVYLVVCGVGVNIKDLATKLENGGR